MNMMIILIGIFLVFIGIMGWMAYGFYRDNKRNIDSIRSCREHKRNKDVLLIDYWRLDQPFSLNQRPTMDHTSKWASPGLDPENPYEDIYRSGYLAAEKWMTSLRYIGIPVFVKLHNFKIIDPRTMDEGKVGFPRNKLTSSIMYNVYKAKTLKKFIDGITKVRFAEMDMKGLGLLIPIIIGLGVGVAYFMLGGF